MAAGDRRPSVAAGQPPARPRALTHLDAAGAARMVDVGDKSPDDRRATAMATVRVSPATAASVGDGDAPKGDVMGTARLAGIQAAKRTWELIPLCHQIPLDHVEVDGEVDVHAGSIHLIAQARTHARTGVEMEALTAAAVAALTVYDMVKAYERGARIENVSLLTKTGGRSDWRPSGS